MRVVLDTNVVVSGAISEHGPPARLLDLVFAGVLFPVVEPRILSEYREVLVRPRLMLPEAAALRLVDALEAVALAVTAMPWPHPLPDEDDEVFIAAADAGAATLVTGNLKHYPSSCRAGVAVLTPRACLEKVRKRISTEGAG